MNNQQLKQVLIKGSDDSYTQAVINKIKTLDLQPIGMYSDYEQQQVFNERNRAIEQLEKLI